MIVDYLATFFLSLFDKLLSPLDAINDIHLNIYFMETIKDCFLVATYVIPVADLFPIVVIFFLIQGWRIIVTLVKTLWDILPFV